jgi:hypothetical protein
MLDLGKATACMAKLAERNHVALRGYAKLGSNDPDPAGTRACLAIAHNHDLGLARATIAAHGLD